MFSSCEVDLASGDVSQVVADLEIVAPLRAHFSRLYLSSHRSPGPLGWCWQHNFWPFVHVSEEAIVKLDPINGNSIIALNTSEDGPGPWIRPSEQRDDFPLTRNHFEFDLVFVDGTWERYQPHPKEQDLWMLVAKGNQQITQVRYHWRDDILASIGAANHRIDFRFRDGLITSVSLLKDNRLLYATEYFYDHNQDLVRSTDSGGQTWSYEYDDHLLIRGVGAGEAGRNYAYDKSRRCILAFSDGNRLVRNLNYDDQTGRVMMSDSYGVRSIYKIDRNGQIAEYVDPAGFSVERIFDQEGGLITTLECDGAADYLYSFDEASNTLRESYGNGIWTKKLDEQGRIHVIISPSGLQRFQTFDTAGRLTKARLPSGGEYLYTYGSKRASVTDPLGYTVTREESSDGRHIRLFDEFGTVYDQTYDELNNLISEVDASGRSTSFSYLTNDVIAQETLPNGGSHRFTYDQALNPTSYLDAVGNMYRTEYDDLGNVVAEIDPLGGRITYEYDREDNLKLITNEQGQKYSFEYNSLYQEITVQSFDSRKSSYARDPQGRLTAMTDANGNTTKFTYHLDGHIASQSFSDGVSDAFTLDEDGRCTGIVRSKKREVLQQSQFSFGPVGELLSESHDGRTLDYRWDLAGNLTWVKDFQGRETRYIFGPRHQVERMVDFDREFSFLYLPTGELTEIAYPNGLRQVFEYDGGGRMIHRKMVGRDGTIKTWRSFVYNAEDDLVSMNDWRWGVFRYKYDACGRLIKIDSDQASISELYTYDPASNLVTFLSGAQAAVGNGNRLNSAGTSTFTYDAEGNRVGMVDGAANAWNYEWDRDGQLTSVLKNGQEIVSYNYDLVGRRKHKITGSRKTEFLYDDYTLRTEIDSEFGVTYYASLPGMPIPIAEQGSGGLFFFSYDQIGTPVEVFDENGDLVYCVHRSAYGTVLHEERLTGGDFQFPFSFMGQYVDCETGLHYNHFRYYDPEVGRYISQDPIGLSAGLNFYSFPNNPNNRVDPLGLMPVFECLSSWGPCRKWYAQMKVDRMNAAMSKRTLRRRCTDCRKDKQRQDFEGRCGGGAGSAGIGRQVDHIHELQAGGFDRCCNNLASIPATFNNQLGTQVGKMLDGPPSIRAGVKGVTGGVINKISTKGCTSKKPCSDAGKKKLARRPPKGNQKCEKKYSKPVALTC